MSMKLLCPKHLKDANNFLNCAMQPKIIEHKNNRITWIDIINPTSDDLKSTLNQHHISATIIDILTSRHISPCVIQLPHCYFINYSFPFLSRSEISIHSTQIFIYPKKIISIHNDVLDFSNYEFNSNTYSITSLLFFITSAIHQQYLQVVRHISNECNSFQQNFPVANHHFVNLTKLQKNIALVLSQIQQNQTTIALLSTLPISNRQPENFKFLTNNFLAITDNIKQHSLDLRHYIRSNHLYYSQKTHANIKIITILLAFILPTLLITAIFSMNFSSIIYYIPFGFFGVLVTITILEIVILNIFKYKKWL